MAEFHPGVVGGPGITRKGPATQERPRPLFRWSSGTTDFPSPDRGMPPPRAGKVSEGSNAVLGRGGLYDESPAPAEEYTVEHKRRGEKSRPHRRLNFREGLARGALCSVGDIHPPLVTLAGAAFGSGAGCRLSEQVGRCGRQGLEPL